MAAVELTATAIATLILTKAVEKTGEELGKKVVEKSERVLDLLRTKFSKLAAAIVTRAEQPPLDVGVAQLDSAIASELAEVAKQDSEIAEAISELEQVAKLNPSPNLAQAIRIIEGSQLGSQAPTIQNFGKVAEEIKAVFQGNVIQNPTFNF